jgi:hypothetical protein
MIDTFTILFTFSIAVQILATFIIAISNKYLKHFFTINLAIVVLRFLCKVLYDTISMNGNVLNIMVTQTFSAVIAFTRVHYPLMTITMAFG